MQYNYTKATAHAFYSTLDNLFQKLGAKQNEKQQHHWRQHFPQKSRFLIHFMWTSATTSEVFSRKRLLWLNSSVFQETFRFVRWHFTPSSSISSHVTFYMDEMKIILFYEAQYPMTWFKLYSNWYVQQAAELIAASCRPRWLESLCLRVAPSAHLWISQSPC